MSIVSRLLNNDLCFRLKSVFSTPKSTKLSYYVKVSNFIVQISVLLSFRTKESKHCLFNSIEIKYKFTYPLFNCNMCCYTD